MDWFEEKKKKRQNMAVPEYFKSYKCHDKV